MLILQDRDFANLLGLAGASDALLPNLDSGLCDGLVLPFNLLSGWRERNLVRLAMERKVGVIARDPAPAATLDELIDATEEAAKVGGWFKRRPASHRLAGAGTYAFLRSTHGWTEPQICLAYALTEPAVATVQVETTDAAELGHLAEAADRDLPAAVSAQIEMARFSADTEANRRSA
jgi:aryl-alcohol dehydrogenase-like predicted oxidoreductase